MNKRKWVTIAIGFATIGVLYADQDPKIYESPLLEGGDGKDFLHSEFTATPGNSAVLLKWNHGVGGIGRQWGWGATLDMPIDKSSTKLGSVRSQLDIATQPSVGLSLLHTYARSDAGRLLTWSFSLGAMANGATYSWYPGGGSTKDSATKCGYSYNFNAHHFYHGKKGSPVLCGWFDLDVAYNRKWLASPQMTISSGKAGVEAIKIVNPPNAQPFLGMRWNHNIIYGNKKGWGYAFSYNFLGKSGASQFGFNNTESFRAELWGIYTLSTGVNALLSVGPFYEHANKGLLIPRNNYGIVMRVSSGISKS